MNKSTNKFDKGGKEIFVGDKVKKYWNWFPYKDGTKSSFRIHTITEKPSHIMENGEWHEDEPGVIFCLGKSYNFWEGKEVTKLSESLMNLYSDLEEDTDYFMNDEGFPQLTRGKEFFNMLDEEWEEHKKHQEAILLWGKKQRHE